MVMVRLKQGDVDGNGDEEAGSSIGVDDDDDAGEQQQQQQQQHEQDRRMEHHLESQPQLWTRIQPQPSTSTSTITTFPVSIFVNSHSDQPVFRTLNENLNGSTTGTVGGRRSHLRTSSSSSSLRESTTTYTSSYAHGPSTFASSALPPSTTTTTTTTPRLIKTRRSMSSLKRNSLTTSTWPAEPTLSELVEVERSRMQRTIPMRSSSATASFGGGRSSALLQAPSATYPNGRTTSRRNSRDDQIRREGVHYGQVENGKRFFQNAGNLEDQDDREADEGDEERTRIEWDEMMKWRLDPPESAILYPPLYGRPGPPPSPDLFTTLLQPLLSLSRPPSPAMSNRSSISDSSPAASTQPVPSVTATAPAVAASIPTTTATSTGDRLPSPSTDKDNSSSQPFGSTKSTTNPTNLDIPDRSASSLPAQFPPRASTDPGPTVESQGFVLYLGSGSAWFMYLIWSLVPDRYLKAMGIAWYPSREWSLLFPAWTIMLAFFIYFSYISINLFITPPIDSYDTLTDPFAFILTPTEEDPYPLISNSILLPKDAVPPLHDLPVSLVNRVVFGDFRKKKKKKAENGGWKGKERKG